MIKVIYPLVFNFGEVVVKDIDQTEKEKYLSLSQKVLKSQQVNWPNSLGNTQKILFRTSKISKADAQERPDYIVTVFDDWLKNTAKVSDGNNLNDKNAVFLIDFRGIDRDQQIFHFSIALTRLLVPENNDQCRAILIFDALPGDDDAIFKHIIDLKKIGKVVLVDKSDEILADSKITLESFKTKLIRKVGHFKLNENSNDCCRYFYDAAYGTKELRKLLLDHLFSIATDTEQFEYIFYTSKVSPWLRETLSAVSGDLEKDYTKQFPLFKGAFNYEQIHQELVDKYKGGNILLVADCINTAHALNRAIVAIQKNFPALASSNFHIISVLNNTSRGTYTDETRTVRIIKNQREFQVPTLVSVNIDEVPSGECPLCKLKIAHTDLEEDNYLKLRSYDFWKLSDKAGYEFEPFKPGQNAEEKLYVPVFLNWLEENASYIAYKFLRTIDEKKVSSQLDFVIIYPDETGQSGFENMPIVKTASGKLAETLKEIFNKSAIGIPRNIITKVNRGKAKMEQINNLKESWVKAIKDIPLETDIIILTDFSKSCKTFECINSIVGWLDKTTKCYFTIADFNPTITGVYNDKHKDVEFCNLYEFHNNLVLDEQS